MVHIASQSPALMAAIASAKARAAASDADPTTSPGFLIVVNWIVPSAEGGDDAVFNFVQIFERRTAADLGASAAETARFDALLRGFIAADDETRNARFKFVSRLVDSTAALSAGIALLGGMRPVLLANKLSTKYFTDEESYLELTLDVRSSSIARGAAGLIVSALKNVVIDMCFLFEGRDEEELPERVWATWRASRLDLDRAAIPPPWL